MNIVIERLDTNVPSPTYAHDKGTSGFDLVCRDVLKIYNGTEELCAEYINDSRILCDEDRRFVELRPFERALFATKQRFIIPDEYEIQIRPKSGVTLKTGVLVQLGTVDAEYRGDLSISVVNCNNETVYVPLDSKLAQGVLVKVERALFNTISETAFTSHRTMRGECGFGSTGITESTAS